MQKKKYLLLSLITFLTTPEANPLAQLLPRSSESVWGSDGCVSELASCHMPHATAVAAPACLQEFYNYAAAIGDSSSRLRQEQQEPGPEREANNFTSSSA